MFKLIIARFDMPWKWFSGRWTGRLDDQRAQAHGWEIECGRFGRRIYRDPRFRAAAANTPGNADGNDAMNRAANATPGTTSITAGPKRCVSTAGPERTAASPGRS